MITLILQLLAAFVIPVLLSLYLTPKVIKFAHVINAVDKPNERKVHKEPMPRFGGVALFCSFLLSLAFYYLIFPNLFDGFGEHISKFGLLALSIFLVFILGAWDDIKPLKPEIKFAIQFLIASLVYIAGFKISTVMNPVTPDVLNVELLDFPLTILWIIGVTNAINLIDGLDGLASGIAVIACVTIFSVSLMYHELWNGLLALMLAGALVGFLRYNFNPAKIFLGDSGSLLLGFALAVLSIQSSTKISTGFSILFPIAVLGLPITDTLLSMTRRFLGSFIPSNGTSTEQSLLRKMYSMFVPDKSHIHHQLLARGFTHRNTVIVLYIISAVFALAAFGITWFDSFRDTLLLLLVVGLGLFWFIKKLRYREIDVFSNGIFLPLYERILLNKVALQSLLDLGFITLSFSASVYIIDWMNPDFITAREFQLTLVVACISQLTIFWLSGLYKENIRLIGLGDVLKVFKSVSYAVLGIGILLPMTIESFQIHNLLFIILDFYFLLTLVLGIRFSYHALKYLFKRTSEAESNILIHGVNDSGLMLLHQILHNYHDKLKPIGFLDENPELEGTYVNGFPVFGGHWKLPRLWQTKKFDRILISANDSVKPVIYDRMKSFSEKHDVSIQKFQFNIIDFTPDDSVSSPTEHDPQIIRN